MMNLDPDDKEVLKDWITVIAIVFVIVLKVLDAIGGILP